MNLHQFLLAAFVPAAWGLGFTLAKSGMEQFPPFLIMAMRFALAALVLVWLARPPWAYMPRIFLVALISATIQYGLTFYGLTGLDASTAVLVVQLESPFLALIATVFLKETFGWRRGVGMVLAFAGVIVIAGEPRLHDNIGSVLLVASGAFVWAIGQTMVSRLRAVGSVPLLAWISVFASPQMFVASLLIEDDQWSAVVNATAGQWGIVLYLGLVMTALAYAVWYRLLQTCEINQVAPFLLLTPVTSVIAGIVLLDEHFTAMMTAGAVLVIAGVAVMTVTFRRAGRDIVDKPPG